MSLPVYLLVENCTCDYFLSFSFLIFNISCGQIKYCIWCFFLSFFFFAHCILLLLSCCPIMSDLCNPMDCSTPGLPVPQHLLEFAQVHVHCISDQSSHLILWGPFLLLPSVFPSIRDFSNKLSVCIRWPKLELQHQSFQWVFKISLTLEPLIVWIMTNSGKLLERGKYQTRTSYCYHSPILRRAQNNFQWLLSWNLCFICLCVLSPLLNWIFW